MASKFKVLSLTDAAADRIKAIIAMPTGRSPACGSA